MGQSTNGVLCYGVAVDEDQEMPWDKYDGDFDEWWIYDVKKYKPSFEIYNSEGEYKYGIEPPRETIKQYYEDRREFKENNEPPFELVVHYGCDYPLYIITANDTEVNTYRDPLEVIEPKNLNIPSDKTVELIEFCKRHNIKYTGEPNWYLCSL